MLDCVLISSDEGFRHAILAILHQPVNQARLTLDIHASGDDLDRETVTKVIRAKADVVFLDLGPGPKGVGAIQTLGQDAPDLALVVGGPALSAEGLLAVMRAGASEFLPRPFSLEEAHGAFQRVHRRLKGKASDRPDRLGRVLTVFSAKGGTGVTTVATNLAVAFRMLTKKRVLLLDLAPSLGTAAIAMGVQPRYTYVDLIRNFHRLDEELFYSFLEMDDSGVRVLSSPISRVGVDAPAETEVHSLFELCRRHFDYVVVDGGSLLTGLLEAFLNDSDDRLMVVTPDLPALRNVKKALDMQVRANGKAPLQVVLNQFKEGMGLTRKDVEDGLGQPVALVLGRDDQRIIESINVGRPEVHVGRSSFSRDLMEYGRKLAGPDAVVSAPKGLLSLGRWSFGGKSGSRKEAK